MVLLREEKKEKKNKERMKGFDIMTYEEKTAIKKEMSSKIENISKEILEILVREGLSITYAEEVLSVVSSALSKSKVQSVDIEYKLR
jgi:hypothetical protein